MHCGICRQGYRSNSPPLFHMCWLTEVRLKSPEIEGDLANMTMRRREHSCTDRVCVCVCVCVREREIRSTHSPRLNARGITLPAHQPLFTSDTHTHTHTHTHTQSLSHTVSQTHVRKHSKQSRQPRAHSVLGAHPPRPGKEAACFLTEALQIVEINQRLCNQRCASVRRKHHS